MNFFDRSDADGSLSEKMFVDEDQLHWPVVLSALVAAVLLTFLGLASTNSAEPPSVISLDEQSQGQPVSSTIEVQLRELNGFSGGWIDADGIFQAHFVTGASTKRAEILLRGTRSHIVADREHSYVELVKASDRISTARYMAEHGIASVGVNEEEGTVQVISLPTKVSTNQKNLESLFGNAWVSVDGGSIPISASGEDSHRDRSPIAGGTSIQLAPAVGSPTRKQCSSSFSLRQSSTNRYFQVTAGHCTEGWEGRLVGSSWSSSPPFQSNPVAYDSADAGHLKFTSYVGTNAGYLDSLCASSYPAHRLWTCGPNSTEYRLAGGYPGDVAALRVTKAEPELWTTHTRRSPVYSVQRTPLVAGSGNLCAAGERTLTYCGLRVAETNVTVMYCDNDSCGGSLSWNQVHLLKGMTRAAKSTTPCSRAGDSGGAVYSPTKGPRGETGGVRAVGIISGVGTGSGCSLYFTPIGVAEKLFGAKVMVHS